MSESYVFRSVSNQQFSLKNLNWKKNCLKIFKMKLIVLCFLVTFACISAQQNGLNTFVYKAIADPTRQIMKTANIPGTQFIDIGEGFAKALDTTVASFIPFGKSNWYVWTKISWNKKVIKSLFTKIYSVHYVKIRWYNTNSVNVVFA